MRKLKLDLEHLAVESFDVANDSAGEGTVEAHAPVTRLSCNSCAISCNGTCPLPCDTGFQSECCTGEPYTGCCNPTHEYTCGEACTQVCG